jgi:hypothetical protein
MVSLKLDLQNVGVHLITASPNSTMAVPIISVDMAVLVVGRSGGEVDEMSKAEKRSRSMRREEER